MENAAEDAVCVCVCVCVCVYRLCVFINSSKTTPLTRNLRTRAQEISTTENVWQVTASLQSQDAHVRDSEALSSAGLHAGRHSGTVLRCGPDV